MAELCLEIRNLKKRFKNKEVLTNISLKVETGEIIGLVGPNGAGKTTLIKILMGLIHPTSGKVRLFGMDPRELKSEQWQELGYISEEPNLYDFMTARELIRFSRFLYLRWDEERCQQYMERFDLPLDEKIKVYSRGMKTQLALVLALVPLPKLLVMDEPLAGLDPIKRIDILNLVIENYVEAEGRTIIISSHHLGELERLVDRAAFVKDGQLTKVLSVEQVKSDEKTIRVVFQKEPPGTLLNMAGIIRVEREGHLGFLIEVGDNFNDIYQACATYPHFVLDVYHRSLEDLYREEFGRGEKR